MHLTGPNGPNGPNVAILRWTCHALLYRPACFRFFFKLSVVKSNIISSLDCIIISVGAHTPTLLSTVVRWTGSTRLGRVQPEDD